MITEKTLIIEPKGVDQFNWRNRLWILFSANENWVVPASAEERRYAVFEVSDAYIQNKDYFAALFEEIDNGGAAAMLFDLLRMDLGDWHPRNDIPQTQALFEQKMQSLDGKDQWWLAKLQTGETPTPSTKNPRWVWCKLLWEEAKAHNIRNTWVTETEFGNYLRAMGCVHKSNGNVWGWIFPPLPEARAAWELKFSGKVEWLRPDITEWNQK